MEQIADKDESLFYFETPLGTGSCALSPIPYLASGARPARRERGTCLPAPRFSTAQRYGTPFWGSLFLNSQRTVCTSLQEAKKN